MKLPPYGKELSARMKWGNAPLFVMLCVGLNAWQSVRRWNKSPNDIAGLVLPDTKSPNQYSWPVSNCFVVIERSAGPSDENIMDLVKALLHSGASLVTVWSITGELTFNRFWMKADAC